MRARPGTGLPALLLPLRPGPLLPRAVRRPRRFSPLMAPGTGGHRAVPGRVPSPSARSPYAAGCRRATPPPACPCPGRRGAGPGPLPVRVTHSAGEGKRRAEQAAAVPPRVVALDRAGAHRPPAPVRWRPEAPAKARGGAAVLPSAGRPRRRRAWALASRGRRPCPPARWSGSRRTSAGQPGTRRRSGSMAVRTFQTPVPSPPLPYAGPALCPAGQGGWWCAWGRVGRGVHAASPDRAVAERYPPCWAVRRRFKGFPRPATPAAAQSPPPGYPSGGGVPGSSAAPSPAGAGLPVSSLRRGRFPVPCALAAQAEACWASAAGGPHGSPAAHAPLGRPSLSPVSPCTGSQH